MLASDFRRDDCVVGGRRKSYATLRREWRCGDCGGRIVSRWNPQLDYYVACGRCGSFEFIHENELVRQQAEAQEVLSGLPPGLAEVLKGA